MRVLLLSFYVGLYCLIFFCFFVFSYLYVLRVQIQADGLVLNNITVEYLRKPQTDKYPLFSRFQGN